MYICSISNLASMKPGIPRWPAETVTNSASPLSTSSKFPFHWPQFPKLFTGRQLPTLKKIIHSKVIMGAVVERMRTLQRYPCFKEDIQP